MSEMVVDGRLCAVAKYVEEFANGKKIRLADIGADHAKLCVYLVEQGIASTALACDVNPLPLESAKKNITEHSLCDYIRVRLSNGLENVKPDECDVITIAGMGGELIAKITDNANDFKNSRFGFVLQPMTKAEKLREYLCENGFEIQDETACCVAGKHYTVMKVVYCGKPFVPDIAFAYMGRLINKNDAETNGYRQKVLVSLNKKLCGARHCGADTTELEKAVEIIEKG